MTLAIFKQKKKSLSPAPGCWPVCPIFSFWFRTRPRTFYGASERFAKPKIEIFTSFSSIAASCEPSKAIPRLRANRIAARSAPFGSWSPGLLFFKEIVGRSGQEKGTLGFFLALKIWVQKVHKCGLIYFFPLLLSLPTGPPLIPRLLSSLTFLVFSMSRM